MAELEKPQGFVIADQFDGAILVDLSESSGAMVAGQSDILRLIAIKHIG